MNNAQAGFLLTRHWRDTPSGSEVTLWLATDSGPPCAVLPPQESVASLPAEQPAAARALLAGQPDRPSSPLRLKDFLPRPAVGLHRNPHRHLQQLDKPLR